GRERFAALAVHLLAERDPAATAHDQGVSQRVAVAGGEPVGAEECFDPARPVWWFSPAEASTLAVSPQRPETMDRIGHFGQAVAGPGALPLDHGQRPNGGADHVPRR